MDWETDMNDSIEIVVDIFFYCYFYSNQFNIITIEIVLERHKKCFILFILKERETEKNIQEID